MEQLTLHHKKPTLQPQQIIFQAVHILWKYPKATFSKIEAYIVKSITKPLNVDYVRVPSKLTPLKSHCKSNYVNLVWHITPPVRGDIVFAQQMYFLYSRGTIWKSLRNDLVV